MDSLQLKVYSILEQMSGEDVAKAFLDYHGTDLIDRGFARHLVDEGHCEPEELGFYDNDEDEEEDDYDE